MTEGERDRIEQEAHKVVLYLDEAPFELLRTHNALHGFIIRELARTTGKSTKRIRRMNFMSAAEQLYARRVHRDLLAAIKCLHEARNIVAHEEFMGELFRKVSELGRMIKGPTYDDSPASVAEARAQFFEILHFVYAWATHP
jgi:hypothetical protein